MAISYSTRRINPITGAVSSRLLTENLTVAEFDFLPGVYGVQTTDGIIQGTLEVSEIGTGGADFVVVSTNPSAGQVASVYTSGFNPQGLLIFNSADNGKNVVVSYRGYGTTTSYENLVALMNSLIDDSTLRYDLDSLAAYVATLSVGSVEYLFNSDTTNANDTTSFGYGATGGSVPTVSSSLKKKRVRASNSLSNATFVLQFQKGGSGPWYSSAGSHYNWENDGVNSYGMVLQPVSDTDIDVCFSAAGVIDADFTHANTWSTLNSNGDRYRVKVVYD